MRCPPEKRRLTIGRSFRGWLLPAAGEAAIITTVVLLGRSGGKGEKEFLKVRNFGCVLFPRAERVRYPGQVSNPADEAYLLLMVGLKGRKYDPSGIKGYYLGL